MAANMISTCSTSSQSTISTSGRWRTRASTSSTRRYILADPDTATDMDYRRDRGGRRARIFPQLVGQPRHLPRLVPASLKEGFTVFRDQSFSADRARAAVKRIEDVRMLRAAQFPEDAGPLAHPIRPEFLHGNLELLHRDHLQQGRRGHPHDGDDARRRAVPRGHRSLFRPFDGTAATCEDFVACMEEGGGVDLAQFRLWYSQAGTPRVSATMTHDTTRRPARDAALAQSVPRDAGPAGQAADGDAAAKSSCSAVTAVQPLAPERLVTARPSRARRSSFEGVSRTAGALDQSRLFRAGDRRDRSHAGRSRLAVGA